LQPLLFTWGVIENLLYFYLVRKEGGGLRILQKNKHHEI